VSLKPEPARKVGKSKHNQSAKEVSAVLQLKLHRRFAENDGRTCERRDDPVAERDGTRSLFFPRGSATAQSGDCERQKQRYAHAVRNAAEATFRRRSALGNLVRHKNAVAGLGQCAGPRRSRLMVPPTVS
jgi:hypothetical protein